MTTSEAINELAAACAKAQADLKPAPKDAKNPHFNSTYADLAAVIEATKVYAKQGIAIFQDATTGEAGVSVTTRLVHTSGQWIELGPLTVPLGQKRDAHGVGSATTYAKRYGLQAAALIPSEDDDGNAATQTASAAPAKPAAEMPKGYVDWLLDLEVVAGSGTTKLKETWDTSPPANRTYLLATNKAKWEALKVEAVRADAKARKVPA